MFPTLLAALLVAQQPAPASVELRSMLEQARVTYHVPGAVAWVSRRGEPLAEAAVGVRRADRDETVGLGDRFHLGSVTKSLNATLIATLVDEGRLRWDETMEEMFPEWPIHRSLRAATLAELLAHRSGLAGFRDQGELADAPALYGEPASQRAQFARWLIARKAEGERGAYLYSNAGVSVAAAAAERVTGKPWEALMRERVFAPLGMKNAGFGWPARDREHEPWGHHLRGARREPHDPRGAYEVGAVIAPAADIHLSIGDLGRFLADQARGLAGKPALLKAETYRRMHAMDGGEPLGWMRRRTRDGHAMSAHDGSAETFYAIVAVGHEDAIEVGVMLNDPDWRAANALFAAIWERFRRPEGAAR
jgi:CubicO group peptidase (beta-lactamase class C family)